MNTIHTLLDEALLVENLLEFPNRYLAHLPREVVGKSVQNKPETLGEHMKLVLQNASRICELNDLFIIIEELIGEVVFLVGFNNQKIAITYLRKLFIDAIVFHDFGKVNEYFQTDRMKNTDSFFQGRHPQIFSPKYGHSELGAYIYTVYHLEKINLLNIPTKDELD